MKSGDKWLFLEATELSNEMNIQFSKRKLLIFPSHYDSLQPHQAQTNKNNCLKLTNSKRFLYRKLINSETINSPFATIDETATRSLSLFLLLPLSLSLVFDRQGRERGGGRER